MDDKKEITSPVKAIRAFCIDCCGGNREWVKQCESKCCPLLPFRFGKNPYSKKGKNMTDEQKQAAAERMKKYWEEKANEKS